MQDRKQLITIKGTRDGLSLFIDDDCAFADAAKELESKIASSHPRQDEPIVSVSVKTGRRYLSKEQIQRITKIIERESRFVIQAIESEVIHQDDARRWKEESEIKAFHRIVRSGQVLEVKGDLLLIGDVNPGGKVVSSGNIYVMGSLFGIAHAGADENRQAFVAASYMKPSQLRIADYISRSPDYEAEGVYMECGMIDEKQDKIVIDRLQVLSKRRRELSRFERRMQNG
ncbi:septum site-determining protein MinC [Virgibacillus xinjiangensis]|uniref:Probable septum site-determining protein MinC n=1 Tax=Virgibacillus xinjiangensis TaxID=393090 RepID=A0ABV7CUB4_9BACI